MLAGGYSGAEIEGRSSVPQVPQLRLGDGSGRGRGLLDANETQSVSNSAFNDTGRIGDQYLQHDMPTGA